MACDAWRLSGAGPGAGSEQPGRDTSTFMQPPGHPHVNIGWGWMGRGWHGKIQQQWKRSAPPEAASPAPRLGSRGSELQGLSAPPCPSCCGVVVDTAPGQSNSTWPCPETKRPLLKDFSGVCSVGRSLVADKSGLRAWTSISRVGARRSRNIHQCGNRKSKLQPRREKLFVQNQKQIPKHQNPRLSRCLLLLEGDRQGHPMLHKLQLNVVLHQFPKLSFHCFWGWTLPDQHSSCTPLQARG